MTRNCAPQHRALPQTHGSRRAVTILSISECPLGIHIFTWSKRMGTGGPGKGNNDPLGNITLSMTALPDDVRNRFWRFFLGSDRCLYPDVNRSHLKNVVHTQHHKKQSGADGTQGLRLPRLGRCSAPTPLYCFQVSTRTSQALPMTSI
jgi:hypothetical protein